MAEDGFARFVYDGQQEPLTVQRVRGVEQLGAPSEFELELSSEAAVRGSDVLGKPCALTIQAPHGERSWHGVVTRLSTIGTANQTALRRYRVSLRSAWVQLFRNRRRKVWQQLSAQEIIVQLFEAAGLDAPELALSRDYTPYEYLTQLDESDGQLVTRLLQQDGMWLRQPADEGGDRVILCDASDGAPSAGALSVVDGAHLRSAAPCFWDLAVERRRAPGKVTLGSYNADNPAHPLLSEQTAGTAGEQAIERYRHRSGSFGASAKTDAALASASERLLNARRSTAATVAFHSNVPLAAGCRVKLSDTPYGVELEAFLSRVMIQWSALEGALSIEAVGGPSEVPFALPLDAPKPQFLGACLGVVTGPAGEEIHSDELGRVRVRFHWDRFGPTDNTSSLPVRVAHPQMQGSLLIPRVGWEVVVMFEDGDPDCPYVLGRLDNGKHRPAAALPENKTMTRLASFSSPAGSGTGSGLNSITIEDAAGRQGLGLVAAKGMSVKVSGNMLAQTAVVDEHTIDTDQSLNVSGQQTISVHSGALVGSCKSQTITVGGNQSFQTPKAMALSTGAVSVSAAALSEQVGSLGGGLGDLARTAAFTAVGSFGGAKGMALVTGATALMAYNEGGAEGAAGELLKTGASMVPGLGTAIEVAEASGQAPWQGQDAQGGGAAEDASSAAGGAQAAGGADEGGSGKRLTLVGASMMQSIGGAYLVSTPGSSSWTTMGLCNLLIGGNHNITSGLYSFQTLGAAAVTTPALNISSAGVLVREGRLMKLTVAGALQSTSGADTVVKAGGGLTISAAALKLTGATVMLECGASKVTIKGGGIVAQSASVKFASTTKAAEASR